MQRLVLGWAVRKEREDLSLTSDWVWSYIELIVELTICILVIDICCVYIDLISTIMDDSHIHLGVRPTLIWWHLQNDTAEVNWLKARGKFCSKADVADVDLASDKVGSRALVDLVRYNFSDGCEIYFVLLVSSLLYSILHTPFNCRNYLDIPRTLGHQKITREQILVHEIIAEARIQFPQRMISSSTEFTQLASILCSSKNLIHTSPLPPSPSLPIPSSNYTPASYL